MKPGAAGDEDEPALPILHDSTSSSAPATCAMYEAWSQRSGLHWFDDRLRRLACVNRGRTGFAADFASDAANPRDVLPARAARCARYASARTRARGCAPSASALCSVQRGQDLEHVVGASASRISRPGSKSVSSPSQTSEMIGVPQAAASNSRTLGRQPARDHVGAGDVQREALRGVERGVLGRRQMLDALDVGRPVDVAGILRPGDDEAQLRRAAAPARAAGARASAGGRRCRCRDSRGPSASARPAAR